MPVIRISLARFDADAFETVRALLEDSRTSLEPAIRRLKGNIAYDVGVDQENGAMTNVSVWETLEDAEQMASMKEMADLASVFMDAGVIFDRPITNHTVLWSLKGQS